MDRPPLYSPPEQRRLDLVRAGHDSLSVRSNVVAASAAVPLHRCSRLELWSCPIGCRSGRTRSAAAQRRGEHRESYE